MDKIPRLLRCAHLLCVEDVVSGLLYSVGSCFAVTCASNRKVITAFRNVALKEPQSYKVNTSGAYFLVSRLHPEQIVDDRAIPVVFKCGCHAQDWAVLEVKNTYNPAFSFTDTVALRPKDQPLPPVTVESTRLMSIFYELDDPYVPFMEATVSSWCRVDHVFSETVQMTEGQYRGSSGWRQRACCRHSCRQCQSGRVGEKSADQSCRPGKRQRGWR
jgi:hypothetical protein